MRSLRFSTGLLGASLAGALIIHASVVTVSAQSDAVWVTIAQGNELLATVAAKPMGELRREDIVPIASSTGSALVNAAAPVTYVASRDTPALSMNARVVPVAQTSLRVPATRLDWNTPMAINGFVLRYWRSNGTAYVQVASVTGAPGSGERESAVTTIALVPGESHELVEAKAFGALPIVISASTTPGAVATIAARSR
jgi:hypothetical protein